MRVGIIAEDDSDVAVVREITLSLLKPHRARFNRFVGNGCGKLRRKCGAWARALVRQGCSWIIVVHDLDTWDERRLRTILSDAIAPAGAKASVVLIPRHEIEAWLMYDGAAIASAFNERRPPRLPGNPESISHPKEHLRDLIWTKYHKEYLNTVHNVRIAARINVCRLTRSLSFAPHRPFSATVRNALKRRDARRSS